MKITEIIAHIEEVAPLGAAASWDSSGMQVACLRESAAHLAVMLDPSPRGVAEALRLGADMILSHHPLLMRPRLPSMPDEYFSVLRMLFAADAPLYSAHTSLDANPRGPVSWLAEAFGLLSPRLLEETTPPFGFGLVGDLPEPLDYGAFTARLAGSMGKFSWRACGPKPETIRRLAFCPGSGADLAQAAAEAGAQAFVTGDVKYHAALDAPIRILDVGHFILEERMTMLLADHLRRVCAPLRVTHVAAADPFRNEASA